MELPPWKRPLSAISPTRPSGKRNGEAMFKFNGQSAADDGSSGGEGKERDSRGSTSGKKKAGLLRSWSFGRPKLDRAFTTSASHADDDLESGRHGDAASAARATLRPAISSSSIHSTASVKSNVSTRSFSFGTLLSAARQVSHKRRLLKESGRQSSLIFLPSEKNREEEGSDEDDDAFQPAGKNLRRVNSSSSGALNTVAHGNGGVAVGDAKVRTEEDLSSLRPAVSSFGPFGKPPTSGQYPKSLRKSHANSALLRDMPPPPPPNHHPRENGGVPSSSSRQHEALGLEAARHNSCSEAVGGGGGGDLSMTRSLSDTADGLLHGRMQPIATKGGGAHDYARHGAEIDIVPKDHRRQQYSSPSIVPKQKNSPHTRPKHQVHQSTGDSPQSSSRFLPRSPTMSRGSDNVLLPGDSDPLPTSMHDSDLDLVLNRNPSGSLDEQLQKSPPLEGSIASAEYSLSSSPSNLERRGSLRRRSSRGSVDSGAKVQTGAGDKVWSLSRKFSISKGGKLGKKSNSRSLEDVSVEPGSEEGNEKQVVSAGFGDDIPDGTEDGDVLAENDGDANEATQPVKQRSTRRRFRFPKPSRKPSDKAKKLSKSASTQNADIQEYTFHPDPNKSKNHVSSGLASSQPTGSSLMSMMDSADHSPKEHGVVNGNESAKDRGRSNSEDSPGPPAAVTQAPAGPSWRGLLNMKKKFNPLDQLFECIERQDFEQAETVLTSGPGFDINETNAEDHTPLDVAVMTDAVLIAKLIMRHGGRENPIFVKNRYIRAVRLTTLVTEAEEQVERLSAAVVALGGVIGSNGNNGVIPPQANTGGSKLKEAERQLRDWEWRYHTLRRMLMIYDRAKAPEAPKWVKLSVQSPTSLRVDFDEPEETNGAVVTRYKIVHSPFPDFTDCQEFIKTDLQDMRHVIEDLEEDVTYYVYVEAFNMQGYSQPCASTPPCGTPSNWRSAMGQDDEQIAGLLDRCPSSHSNMMTLDNLAQCVLDQDGEDFQDGRGLKRNWFKSSGKFTHSLEPGGLYLAFVNFTEDNRIQVTADNHLPMLMVDLDYNPSQHATDILWFSKLACSWKDTRQMKAMIPTEQASPTLAFRQKLLMAALHAQMSFGQVNLGMLHHEILSDFSKTTVLVVSRQVAKSQSAASGNRWVPIARFLRKRINPERPNTPGPGGSGGNTNNPGTDRQDSGTSAASSTTMIRQESTSPPHNAQTGVQTLLVNQVRDVISFSREIHHEPPRGLYVGLLKLRTTVSALSIYTSKTHPLMLPFMKISDNPNISRDEWLWLQRVQATTQASDVNPLPDEVTQHGRTFQQRLARGAARLLTRYNLDEGEEDIMENYYIYSKEVIELNDDVTIVLLLPLADSICLAPGQQCALDDHSDIMCLPLPYLEVAQRIIFSPAFGDLYARLSSLLDCRCLCSQQLSRMAFTKEENVLSQADLGEVTQFQSDLETIWDRMRWIRDIVQLGKDRLPDCTIVLRRMFTAGIGTSSAHALPSFARRGSRVNTRKSLQQHASWSSTSMKVHHNHPQSPQMQPQQQQQQQQQQQLTPQQLQQQTPQQLQQQQQQLILQAKRQRSHLQRRASLETTEIFNDMDQPVSGGNEPDGLALSRNRARSTPGEDGGVGVGNGGGGGSGKEESYARRQSSFSATRRGSVPSMSYSSSGGFSTLPRSYKRSSTEKRAVIEESLESGAQFDSTGQAGADQSSSSRYQAQSSASKEHHPSSESLDAHRILSDPNVIRQQRPALDLGQLSRSPSDVAPAAAASHSDTTPMGAGRYLATPSPQHSGRTSPEPPQRSSSHRALQAHRMSYAAVSPADPAGGTLSPTYPSRGDSLSPDATLGRMRRHTVAGKVEAFEHVVRMNSPPPPAAADGHQNHSSTSTSPDGEGLVYSSSYSSASSSYIPSTSSGGVRATPSPGPSGMQQQQHQQQHTLHRSLSPSSSGSSSSSHSGSAGGLWGDEHTDGNAGAGKYATLRSSAQPQHMSPRHYQSAKTLPPSRGGGGFNLAPSQPPATRALEQQDQAQFRRTPPLRRKNCPAPPQQQQQQQQQQDTARPQGDASRLPGYGIHANSQRAAADSPDSGNGGAQPPAYARFRDSRPQSADSPTGGGRAVLMPGTTPRPSSGQMRRSTTDSALPHHHQQQQQQYAMSSGGSSDGSSGMLPPAYHSSSMSASQLQRGSYATNPTADAGGTQPFPVQASPGIVTQGANWVRVFPFFASHLLAKGTNIKLQISMATTCRDVIQLVVSEVKRLTSGSPRASTLNTDISVYCLVTKVESRDCPLPDDFKPLELSGEEARRQMYIRERSPAEKMLQQGQSTSV